MWALRVFWRVSVGSVAAGVKEGQPVGQGGGIGEGDMFVLVVA